MKRFPNTPKNKKTKTKNQSNSQYSTINRNSKLKKKIDKRHEEKFTEDMKDIK